MNPGKKNILFLASWYPHDADPSLGIFIRRHAQAVATQNNVAVVYAISRPKQKSAFEVSVKTIENVLEVVVYFRKTRNRLPGISQFFKLKRYIAAIQKGLDTLKENQFMPDILHLNTIFPAGLGAISLAELQQLPMVITEHWTGYLPEDGNYQGTVMTNVTQKTALQAQQICPVSHHLGKAMRSHGLAGNYTVVPNVVDTDFFTLKEQAPAEVCFLSIVNMDDAQKNVRGILKVMSEMKEHNFTYLIAGEGDERPQLEQLVDDDPFLRDKVRFVGRQSGAGIRDLLHQASALVMFSNYENLPCVMIEAWATGTPVISTNVGGIPEHLERHDDPKGMLISAGDPEDLQHALTKVAEGKEFDANFMRQYAIEHFSKSEVAHQFQVVYDKIGQNEKQNEE